MGGEGGGTMNVSVAKAGTRSEMDMKMGPMDMKMVMLQKNDTPDIIYRINDANKTYTEMDLAKMRANGRPAAGDTGNTPSRSSARRPSLATRPSTCWSKSKPPPTGPA